MLFTTIDEEMVQKSEEKNKLNGDSQVLLFLLVLASILWIVKFFWEKQKISKKAAGIPSGRTGTFGIIIDFFGKSVDGCFQQVRQYYKYSPEIFKIWFGSSLIVAVSKPEQMELVMTHPNSLGKGSLMDHMKSFMGEGLVCAPVNKWKRNRKLINPSFNQKVLNSYIPIFSEKCEIMMGILEEHVGEPDANITKTISACLLDIVCEAVMGLEMNAQTSSNSYGESLNKAMEIVMERMFNILYHPEMIFKMTKAGKLLDKLVKELHGFSQVVIKERKAVFEQKLQGLYVEEESRHGKTFLDLLLEVSHKGAHFSDLEIQNDVDTMIAAATDSISKSMSFCCLLLAMFPEYQEKVYEEAIEVLGEDRYATKEDLPKLKLTEMCIKETLRLFPVIPLLVRVASDDIKIDDKMVIPKDSTIVLFVLHLHRSPKYWEDPLKFNPYRFLPEEWAKKHPYSFLPFSGGPRNCIGHKYAMIVMQVVLSKIVRKFRLKTDYKCIEDIDLELHLLLRPKDGFKISFEHRN